MRPKLRGKVVGKKYKEIGTVLVVAENICFVTFSD
jgi:hypothetical protein